jgi:hypothetical protein
MDNIIDLIATDSSPAEIADGIKAALFAKSAEKLNDIRPYVASSLFGAEESENSFEDEE